MGIVGTSANWHVLVMKYPCSESKHGDDIQSIFTMFFKCFAPEYGLILGETTSYR